MLLLLLRCMNTSVFFSCGWMQQIGTDENADMATAYGCILQRIAHPLQLGLAACPVKLRDMKFCFRDLRQACSMRPGPAAASLQTCTGLFS